MGEVETIESCREHPAGDASPLPGQHVSESASELQEHSRLHFTHRKEMGAFFLKTTFKLCTAHLQLQNGSPFAREAATHTHAGFKMLSLL